MDFYTKFSSSALQTVRPNSQCSFLTLTGLAFLEHASYSLQGNTAKNSKAAHTTSLSDTKSSFPVLITAYYFASPPSLYLCKQLHNWALHFRLPASKYNNSFQIFNCNWKTRYHIHTKNGKSISCQNTFTRKQCRLKAQHLWKRIFYFLYLSRGIAINRGAVLHNSNERNSRSRIYKIKISVLFQLVFKLTLKTLI